MIKLDEIYQSREFKSLDDIFANDSTGLLDDVKPATKKASANNLLEQQFLVQKSVSLEASRFTGRTTDTLSGTTSPRGFLKGRHYGSFYYGPSSPTSIMAYVRA